MAKLNIKERSEMTFEEKMKRLDEIVKTMSENKLPLEDTIKIFEEGQKLIKELKEQLKTAEEKVVKEIN
jgi:exodeoxyribonuclease VII small subunit